MQVEGAGAAGAVIDIVDAGHAVLPADALVADGLEHLAAALTHALVYGIEDVASDAGQTARQVGASEAVRQAEAADSAVVVVAVLAHSGHTRVVRPQHERSIGTLQALGRRAHAFVACWTAGQALVLRGSLPGINDHRVASVEETRAVAGGAAGTIRK